MSKSATEWFAEANELFVDEQFEEAGESYDKAIELDPTNARYYLHRASNKIKLEDYLEAIPDCEKSLELKPDQHKPWERKGTAYFEMDEFESALESFEKAKELGNKHCDLMIRKCKVELKQEEAPKKRKKKKQPKQTTTTTTTTTTATVDSDDNDDKDSDDTDEDSDLEGITGDSWHPKPKVQLPKPEKKPKIRLDWCQSFKKLTITIFVKNMKKEDVSVTCEDQKIHCKLTTPDGEEFDRTWHLWGRVKPHKMSYSVVKPKVEIVVPKKTKGDWESLEDKVHEKKNKSSVRRQNMHTEYTQQKDKKSVDYWNKLDQEMKKEEEELKPEGQDAMDKLFKQIYRDATPETRRAMMKSYQTSGGTVLSTNWDEVGKTDYEKNITPPKGMELRHYKDEM